VITEIGKIYDTNKDKDNLMTFILQMDVALKEMEEGFIHKLTFKGIGFYI
jgi:hypothetical protein